MPDTTDPRAELLTLLDAAAKLNAAFCYAEGIGAPRDGLFLLLSRTLTDADRLAASLVGADPVDSEGEPATAGNGFATVVLASFSSRGAAVDLLASLPVDDMMGDARLVEGSDMQGGTIYHVTVTGPVPS